MSSKTLAAFLGLVATQALAIETRIVRSNRGYELKIKEAQGLRSMRSSEILEFLKSPRAEKNFELLKEAFGLREAENLAELIVHVKNLAKQSHMKDPNIKINLSEKAQLEKLIAIIFSPDPVAQEEEFLAVEEAKEPVVVTAPEELKKSVAEEQKAPDVSPAEPEEKDVSIEDLEKELEH